MKQRDAKRLVCKRVAEFLTYDLQTESHFLFGNHTEADVLRIRKAAENLVYEMQLRAKVI